MNLHWSVVSVIVNIVSIVMFLTAIATPHWAEVGGSNPINSGMFQACVQVNRTCYDTSVYYDAYAGTVRKTGHEIIKTFVMLNLTEHEMNPAHKDNCWYLTCIRGYIFQKFLLA